MDADQLIILAVIVAIFWLLYRKQPIQEGYHGLIEDAAGWDLSSIPCVRR